MKEDFAGERQNERQRQEARDTERARKFAVEQLMSTPQGRKFVWDELSFCHLYEVSIVFGSFDATAFREGERNVGQRLMMAVQQYCPYEYLIAVRENAPVKLADPAKTEEEDTDV